MTTERPTPRRPAPLIVLAGPSGVGKTTIVAEMLAVADLPVRRAVTATSRPPRPGEVPGVDYHYWPRDRFARAVDAGGMLEHALVHGTDYYGTPLDEVVPHRLAGVGVVLVIDVQGAATVRRKCGRDAVTVFVAPPSFAELEARLLARGTESIDRVARRLASAERELLRAGEFDCVLMNDTLPAAAGALQAIVRGQFQLREALAMLDDLKEEEIVNKVGGRFKLSTLIQKRMVALNTGAKPLVDLRGPDKMAIVLEEILQDKIYLDPTGEVQTQNMTVSENLPARYYAAGTAAPAVPPPPAAPAADDDD